MAPNSVPVVTVRCWRSRRTTTSGASADRTRSVSGRVPSAGEQRGVREQAPDDLRDDDDEHEGDEHVGDAPPLEPQPGGAQRQEQRGADEDARRDGGDAGHEVAGRRREVDERQRDDRQDGQRQDQPEPVEVPGLVVEQDVLLLSRHDASSGHGRGRGLRAYSPPEAHPLPEARSPLCYPRRRDYRDSIARARRLHPRDRRRRPSRGAAPVHRHPLPPRAERLPPHRPRQVDLPQLRHRPRVRRPLPPALRRHQPDEGRAGVHRRHRGRRPLAGLRLGRAPLLRVGLLRAALRVGDRPHQGRQGLRGRPLGRRDPRAPRHLHRARPRQPVARAAGRGEHRPLRAHARRGVPRRRARPAREDRHGRTQHQPARPGAVPDRARASIRAPATPGACIPPTTSRMGSRTPSRASRTPSARSSSRRTGRSTTGSSTTCRCRRGRTSTSSRG